SFRHSLDRPAQKPLGGTMSEGWKIAFGAVASFIVAVLAAIVGYHIRDSYDAPKLSIEKVVYRVSRANCALTPEAFYRFRTTPALVRAIDSTVPWSVEREIDQGDFEYDHVEDMIRQLPIRRDHVQKEAQY